MLQVLPDTDDSAANRAAVELHGALVGAGLAVRTVAIAPGRRGGLAGVLPAVSPSRRSLAALGELRRESRWADVVLFHGTRSLPPFAGMLRRGPRAVLLLDGEERPPRSLARLRRSGALREVPARERPSAAEGWVDLLVDAAP